MIKIKDYEITINEEKSPLSCYNRLHEYKIGAKEITPEFCKDILSATDNPKVTREIIELIKQKTDKNLVEYAKYRPLLIGSILNRKEQKSVLEKMRDLIDVVNEKNSRLNTEDYLLTSLVYAGLKISLPTYLQNQDIDKRDIKNIENYLLEQKVYQEQTKILQEAQKKATEGKIFNLKQTNNTERGYLGHQNLEDYSKLEIDDIKILTIDNCQNIPQANNIDSSKLELLNIEQTDLHGLVLRLPESITDISFKDVTHFSKDIDFSNLQKLWRVLIEQFLDNDGSYGCYQRDNARTLERHVVHIVVPNAAASTPKQTEADAEQNRPDDRCRQRLVFPVPVVVRFVFRTGGNIDEQQYNDVGYEVGQRVHGICNHRATVPQEAGNELKHQQDKIYHRA